MADPVAPEGLDDDLVAATRSWATQTRLLVAIDFDGTLAHFAADPMTSHTTPASDAALRRLALDPGTQLALISGRPLQDLASLASPPPGTYLVGSHGVERAVMTASGPGPVTVTGAIGNALQTLEAIDTALASIAAQYPGTWIEIKPFARAIHTRSAPRDVATAATQAALAGPGVWPDVHVLPGKEVVEIAVVKADKGEALTAVLAELHHANPDQAWGSAFLGDDVTDEDAFAVLPPIPIGLSIKVGPGATHATFRVTGPDGVGIWLGFMAGLRGV